MEEIYSQDIQNPNCVHKGSEDLLSVIITLGTDANGGEIVFNIMTMIYMGKITHLLNHSHVRCMVGAFDKNVHEVSI